MGVCSKLASLAGAWSGTNRLSLTGSQYESASTAVVSPKANAQFLSIKYTWSHEGKPQEGLLLLGADHNSNTVQLVWTDSWHISHQFIVCDGTAEGSGGVEVKGSYQVPGHPDRGWKTQIIPNETSFKLAIYNASPEGGEELAVKIQYSRA